MTSTLKEPFENRPKAPNLNGKVIINKSNIVYRGPYSWIYRGEFIEGGEMLAIKVINKLRGISSLSMQRKLNRELTTWGALRHPNILPLYGYVDDDEDLFQEFVGMISPWRQRGDAGAFFSERGRSMDIEVRTNIWNNVVAGVHYLHSYKPVLIHGDLKPGNILIDDSGTAQICDFGLLRVFLDEGHSGMTTTSLHTGTDLYLAYELVVGDDQVRPTTSSDIYALSCIGLEFLFLQRPYSRQKNKQRIFIDIRNKVPPAPRPADLNPSLKFAWDEIVKCWNPDPLKRPRALDILAWLENWKYYNIVLLLRELPRANVAQDSALVMDSRIQFAPWQLRAAQNIYAYKQSHPQTSIPISFITPELAETENGHGWCLIGVCGIHRITEKSVPLYDPSKDSTPKRLDDLFDHVRDKHFGSPTFRCTFPSCLLTFTSKRDLSDHERAHNTLPCGYMPCYVCENAFPPFIPESCESSTTPNTPSADTTTFHIFEGGVERKGDEEEARHKDEEAKKQEAAGEEDARRKAEAKKSAQEEEGAQRLKEQEAAAAAAAGAQASNPLGSMPVYASSARSVTALPKSVFRPSLDPMRRPILGRLNLSSTTGANLPQLLPSVLASARIIEDIGKVSYPEGINAPSSELNLNASSGKFRYDRDFLMQFMKVCKEKPDDMPSLDAIGLEPSDQQGGFAGRRGRPSMPATASTRGPMGLGLSGPAGAPFGGKSFGGGVGQFQASQSSEERFAATSIPRAISGAIQLPRQPLGRTKSTSGPPIQGVPGRRDALQRPQSGRGSKRNDSKVVQQLSGMHNFISAEPDLHDTENSWSTPRRLATQDPNSPEFIDRKVRALLSKLTMDKFDSISEQILEWANRSVNEVDGRTLIQVIRLVFEKATDEATWSEMYARLCRFLMERISQDVRDEGIKNADGKPIAGGNLFRKYLLNQCQKEFERGWSAREAAMLAAASKAEDDKAVAAAAEKAGTGEEILYSDEYYASQKAKRRGLGLVKFTGELFKLEMLTERIMHECIKKLLSNVENPEEEEIESLCTLLATVGQALDTQKARNHMDIYFGRMQELGNSSQISSRIQYMLIDIIELRTKKWVSRTQVAAPTTIAELHPKAERDRQVAEKEAALRQAGGRDYMRSNRRDTRDYGPPQAGVDGWTTPTSATRPPTKAGDLSNFGKISKSTLMHFGPSSVFSKEERRESGSSMTRASSSSNMFATLNSSEAAPDAGSVGSRTANSTRPPSRKGSIDLSASSIAIGLSASSIADTNPQRKRLLLQPRAQNLASDAGSVKDDGGSAIGQSEISDEDAVSAAASTLAADAAPASMSLEQAKRKIKEDLKELFMLRQLSEAPGYFSALPAEFRWYLVEDLVHRAVDAKATDVQLISEVFDLVASKSLVDEEQFSRGFAADMEYLEDTSTDSPNAYGNVAILLKASKLSQAAVERLADKIIVEGDMAVTPKEKLLKKYTALMT